MARLVDDCGSSLHKCTYGRRILEETTAGEYSLMADSHSERDERQQQMMRRRVHLLKSF